MKKSDRPSKARDPKLTMSIGDIIKNSEELKKAFNIREPKNEMHNLRKQSNKTEA